jgi:hypothetical protein
MAVIECDKIFCTQPNYSVQIIKITAEMTAGRKELDAAATSVLYVRVCAAQIICIKKERKCLGAEEEKRIKEFGSR